MWPFKKKEKDWEVYINSCELHCKEGMLPNRKERCPKWVVLIDNQIDPKTQEKKSIPTGRCAIAWIPTLLVEIKEALKQKGATTIPWLISSLSFLPFSIFKVLLLNIAQLSLGQLLFHKSI